MVAPAPILATKLYIPLPRAKAVLRPRLMERLGEGLHRTPGVTLISAPAGFGKTTLVSEWAATLTPTPSAASPAGRGERVAWLSLDEGDNDLTRFLTYLVAALQMIAANIGIGVLGVLHDSQPQPPTESILTTLLNEITSIPDDFIIILDDYHVIESEAVDNALTFLLDHLPPQMHLVIATREDPQLPLSRLRARGQLTELRAADLRFTPSEAAEFLNNAMGLDLAAEDIAALETRTEGWIAGLQLAALSMRGQHDTSGFIQSFTGSHRFVLDYLVEEVLGQQSESVQDFLLRTSILDRMCGSLCDAVLLHSSVSGQATLEYLERANLFIVPLDNERRWYRYHHLFGDLLGQRLMQSLKPDEIAQCHLCASQWYEENGDLDEAFHHAIPARDFNRAAGLAEMAWQGMDSSFQTAAWLGWVMKLPEEAIRVRPVLSTQIGYAFMDAGEPEASESRLRDAERILAGSSDGTYPDQSPGMVVANESQLKPLPAMIALARAYNAQVQGDLAATVKYAELALQLIPEDDFVRRAQATITLEITHWASGDLDAARRAMDHWMNSMQKVGNLVFVVASSFAVADIQVAQGCLREAKQTYQDALQLAAQHSPESETVTAHHHLGLALISYERGENEAAAQHLQTAAELGQRTTLVDWPHRWNLAQARLKESAREWDAALDLLDKAGRVYVKNPVPILRPVEALKTRIYLKQGRLDKATSWSWERGLSVTDEVNYLGEYEYLTLARVRLAEGSFAGVNDMLERLLSLAEAQKRAGSVIEILLTQALVHQAQGNWSQALATLERALALAEPEGYLRIFVDEGEAMRLLISDFRLTIATRAHPLLGYVDRILDFFPEPVEDRLQSKIANQKSKMVEPLTDRELEILRLIAEGYSNAEISQRLYLALSTVKGHNLRIFNKLQAQNRTEAVARARELDLL